LPRSIVTATYELRRSEMFIDSAPRGDELRRSEMCRFALRSFEHCTPTSGTFRSSGACARGAIRCYKHFIPTGFASHSFDLTSSSSDFLSPPAASSLLQLEFLLHPPFHPPSRSCSASRSLPLASAASPETGCPA